VLFNKEGDRVNWHSTLNINKSRQRYYNNFKPFLMKVSLFYVLLNKDEDGTVLRSTIKH